jgi:hypothetical protein
MEKMCCLFSITCVERRRATLKGSAELFSRCGRSDHIEAVENQQVVFNPISKLLLYIV